MVEQATKICSKHSFVFCLKNFSESKTWKQFFATRNEKLKNLFQMKQTDKQTKDGASAVSAVSAVSAASQPLLPQPKLPGRRLGRTNNEKTFFSLKKFGSTPATLHLLHFCPSLSFH